MSQSYQHNRTLDTNLRDTQQDIKNMTCDGSNGSIIPGGYSGGSQLFNASIFSSQ